MLKEFFKNAKSQVKSFRNLSVQDSIRLISAMFGGDKNFEKQLTETYIHESDNGRLANGNEFQVDPGIREDVVKRKKMLMSRLNKLGITETDVFSKKQPPFINAMLAALRYAYSPLETTGNNPDWAPSGYRNYVADKDQMDRIHQWGEFYNRGGAYKKNRKATVQEFLNDLMTAKK